MAISIDTTQALRRPADLLGLVRAVVNAMPEDEAHWVEWKGSLPLDKAEGWFSLARQILGFANRHPDRAARFAGGLGYLIVGAEPGATDGVVPVDVAKLDDWLRPYLGAAGPVWSPTFLEVDGVAVLVILVEPPGWGDPIYPLRRTYQPAKGTGSDKGTIFVRREAKIERASDDEIDFLQERLTRAQRAPTLTLELDWVDRPLEIAVVDLSERSRAAWVDARREALMRSFDERRAPTSDSTEATPYELPPIGGRMAAALRAAQAPGRQQYEAEVEEYLQKADEVLDDVVMDRIARAGISTVRLAMGNPTDRNLPAVRLTLVIQGVTNAYDAEEVEQGEAASLPPTPQPYSPRRRPEFPLLASSIFTGSTRPPVLRPFAVDIDKDGEGLTRLVFHLGDVRPRDRVELDPFVLVAEDGSPAPIEASWTVTSTGVDAVQEGVFAFPLRARVLTLLDVVR